MLFRSCVVPVLGRKDWPPESKEGVERIFGAEKPVTTQVLPRDKLVGILHQDIVQKYADSIVLHYNAQVEPLDFDYQGSQKVLLQVSQCEESNGGVNEGRSNPISSSNSDKDDDVTCIADDSTLILADFVVAADGTVRTIANAMEALDEENLKKQNPLKRFWSSGRRFSVKRYEDDNQRVYKTIPMKVAKDWRSDLNYSARTKEGRINLDALPANRNGDYCGVLLLKRDDPLAQANTDPKVLRQTLDEALPQFSVLLDDETVAQVAKKPANFLPGFRYAGPRLHQDDSTLLLGDCAHTVKPYFGLGANSALQDVSILADCLDETNSIAQAVHLYSRKQAPQAKQLVRLSRDLDRPGKLGFITFVLPLILDSIFGKRFPKLFQPNVISMLQKEDWSFSRVARRKRWDRLVQVSMLGGALWTIGWSIHQFIIKQLAKLIGKSSLTTSVMVATLGVGFNLIRKRISKIATPDSAPGDVVAKLEKKK